MARNLARSSNGSAAFSASASTRGVELEPRELAIEIAGQVGRRGFNGHVGMVGGYPAAVPRTRRACIRAGSVVVTDAGTHSRPRLESTTFPPFARLALAYAIGVAGDVFVTVSLADSLFFSATHGPGAPEGLALPRAHPGAVRAHRAGLRAADRPHPRRETPAVRGDDGRTSGVVPGHGRARGGLRPVSARVRGPRAVQGAVRDQERAASGRRQAQERARARELAARVHQHPRRHRGAGRSRPGS